MALVAWPTASANSYISNADADTYFADALHAATWEAASETSQDQALVTATRMLDRQRWVSEPSTDATAVTAGLQWPREDAQDRYGNTLDNDALPQEILDATCELALALLEDAATQTNKDAAQNIRRVAAGSAQVEFFRPRSGGRFPTIVQELVGLWLEGATSGALVESFGTDGEALLDTTDTFGVTEGF